MADIVRILCRNYSSMTGTGRNRIVIEMYLNRHVARAGTKDVGHRYKGRGISKEGIKQSLWLNTLVQGCMFNIKWNFC